MLWCFLYLAVSALLSVASWVFFILVLMGNKSSVFFALTSVKHKLTWKNCVARMINWDCLSLYVKWIRLVFKNCLESQGHCGTEKRRADRSGKPISILPDPKKSKLGHIRPHFNFSSDLSPVIYELMFDMWQFVLINRYSDIWIMFVYQSEARNVQFVS